VKRLKRTKMKKYLLLSVVGLIGFTGLKAATISQSLYINRGIFTTVDTTLLPSLAFNSSPVYNSLNTVIDVNTSDVLILKVINNDTVIHGFDIKGYTGVSATINPGDSIIDTLTFSSERIYIYYDNYQYPANRYMGLGGMICVSNSLTVKKYYWNIKEHQKGFNNQLAAGNPVTWTQYEPDYFTINGKSFPDLQNDTTARVVANIGDTVHIFVVNTGQSTHSIHFHGFHCRAVFSTQPQQTNWVKDTFSVRSMEGYVLEMVPDKVGQYSVHDHNLVAVSGGGTHPNGMFLIMLIQ
jgi:FtsP/CotA-like multicopper oxidase with cupredoxin domain